MYFHSYDINSKMITTNRLQMRQKAKLSTSPCNLYLVNKSKAKYDDLAKPRNKPVKDLSTGSSRSEAEPNKTTKAHTRPDDFRN